MIDFFKAFEKSIIGSGICKYTTIVRTSFTKFQDKGECEKDKKKLIEENVKIAEILKSCYSIVHVDNPPMNTIIKNDDDKEMNRIYQLKRNESRNVLLQHLEHLETVFKGKYFRTKTWNKSKSRPTRRCCCLC